MWSTHYHGDHVGSLLALAKQLPIARFYDHGAPHQNDRIVSAAFLKSYEDLSRGKRTIVKPGDKVRMTGLDITTVASANQYIRANLRGGGRRIPRAPRLARWTRAPISMPTTGSRRDS